MATDGDKQGKEAVKPAAGAKPASSRAKTAPRAGAKSAGTSGRTTTRPAGRAAAKPAAKAGTKAAAKPGAKSTAKPAAKSAAKPAARTARGATATARADKSDKSDKPSKMASAKAVKTDESTDGTGPGINREMKRSMKKREGAADRLKRAPTAPSRKRTKPLTFLKEVKGELGRVAWPTRNEVVTYSVVVLVTVIFFMVVIAGIDYVALKGVLFLIDRGGR
jgi:preprotein translocase SecE subunit